MPPPPSAVVQWLKKTYPKPTVDPEWLEGCYTWIQDELQLDPVRDMAAIIENVNTQLLESDFADSMVAGTGFLPNALNAVHAVIDGPILVEVIGIMDIGHSAYSLQQVYDSRIEYRKQAEIRDASGDEDQRKPMPKYPRSMLQLQLSDGSSVLPGIEFKSLPQFELGETPLGCKVSEHQQKQESLAPLRTKDALR
ncbi:hypothetical protein K466DRAFT_490839 [Polyporus arcularius HHB13444]|uniref:RecQ-mediated genome instability protein 1 n=1 Tax=Polyporus arcularius HHB13444 TaxID=1314778 RepID=A0A5C3PCK7_9APHY|nr:hypothetical protein K466DRAFT_490839 [Polyporus arcularius HHB13444]